MSVEIETGVPVPTQKVGKLGRWKEVAQGMEVGGPGVLLKARRLAVMRHGAYVPPANL